MYTNEEIELIEFMEELNFTLSIEFIDKWKFRFSEKFLESFQFKIMECLKKSKQLKKSTLHNYLTGRCKYNVDQVNNFFESIDLDSLYPLIR